MRRKIACLLLCAGILFSCAAAEQEVPLGSGRYVIDVPDWMEYSDAVDGGTGMEAYVSVDLEMDFFAYSREDAAALGMADTLRETAKTMKAAGTDVQIRKVNRIEMLCYRTEDEEDGTPCIGYLFEDGEWIVEIDFWYATEEAADQAKSIMETIRKTED